MAQLNILYRNAFLRTIFLFSASATQVVKTALNNTRDFSRRWRSAK
jgi:hypothetical protein